MTALEALFRLNRGEFLTIPPALPATKILQKHYKNRHVKALNKRYIEHQLSVTGI
jgi:hypothetical protein